jgi:beta-glucanase (GH16 family)
MTFDDEFRTLSVSDSTINDGHSTWYSQVEQCCMSTSDGSKARMARAFDGSGTFSLIPGGGMKIQLQKNSNEWTSGVLTSVDASGKGFSQEYGYFEISARFPTGMDTWPAFWLLSTAARTNKEPAGEIDIVEYIANSGFPNYISSTLHDWSKEGVITKLPESHYRVPSPTGGFHTYGVMWTSETMTFYCDGSTTFQAPTPAIMRQPYYIVFDLGIGAGWPTGTTPPENDLQVQYVRVYKQKPSPKW